MKKVFFAAVIALGILAAGCSKEQVENEGQAGKGSLTVTIRGANVSESRSIGNEPTQATENTVFNYAVYVFNSGSGAYEAHGIFNGINPGVITDLSTASAKKVVVLVNYDFTNMPDVENYSDLDEMAVNINSQIPNDFTTDGLFMSGEDDGIQIVANTTTPVTIPVERVVAKVRLASLTIRPDANSDINLLQIEGVSMQKVPYWAYMLGDYTYEVDATEPHTYVGGIAGGDVSLEVFGHLHDAYSLPTGYTAGGTLNPNIYYYVLPNDAVDNEATLLTIYGKYNGKDAYYTFMINNEDQATGGTGTADGTYIKRNMIYDLNVVLSKLSLYADNPDAVNELGNIEVTITVSDWAGNLIQNVTW